MRLAIVTGGSRGLGLALCRALVARGYRVVEFSRAAPHSFSVSVDFADPRRSQEIVARTIEPLVTQPVERLVVIGNAATVGPLRPLSSISSDEAIASLNINVVSPVLCLGTIVAAFQQDVPCQKTLAFISSGAATKAYAGASLYCAAKAAMEQVVRALALEQQNQKYPFVAGQRCAGCHGHQHAS